MIRCPEDICLNVVCFSFFTVQPLKSNSADKIKTKTDFFTIRLTNFIFVKSAIYLALIVIINNTNINKNTADKTIHSSLAGKIDLLT